MNVNEEINQYNFNEYFDIIDIVGDGNCGIYSILYGLKHIIKYDNYTEIEEKMNKHKEIYYGKELNLKLRKMIYDEYLKEYKDKIKVLKEENKVEEERIKRYKNVIDKNNVYQDKIYLTDEDLMIISRIFNICIQIIHPDKLPEMISSKDINCIDNTVFLLYKNDNHYDILKPKKNKVHLIYNMSKNLSSNNSSNNSSNENSNSSNNSSNENSNSSNENSINKSKKRKRFDFKSIYNTPEKLVEYPKKEDTEFQKKTAMKKEFNYTFSSEEKNCDNKIFTLASHQEFVKRFINYNTQYNGLLLFHGLGSGKTCSAIGITEESRKYIKYNKDFKKILIVASPNVQENFKLQLFDEHKLEKINNRWILKGCLGSSLLQELNIENDSLIKKEDIIKKVNRLIKKYYNFLGYIEFANIIEKIVDGNIVKNKNKLKDEFKNRMIIIDEIHNIRTDKEINNDELIQEDAIDLQKVAKYLDTLVKNVKYMKLVFLTGTPMFNNVKEIVYILNILRQNDKYKMIKSNEIFDKEGNLLENGVDKLYELSNGYVSYVRGENPYTFPFLFYPETFDKNKSIKSIEYPRYQFNNKEIIIPIQYLDLYKTYLNDGIQYYAYMNELESIKNENEKVFYNMTKINYHKINRPLQSLNIVYKTDTKQEYLLGKEGINYTFNYKTSGSPPVNNSFEYKNNKDMFNYDNIEKYSIKIKLILDCIKEAEGIILIYSQWLDSGLVPMALALEELGYSRYGDKTKNLINNKKDKYSYSIICGDKKYSPDNNKEIFGLTNNNVNGEKVKVVLISQAGTEGIDLKNIRQVHIMEPWYNMNRIEQIIGRARRQCSHKDLSTNERNVQVFLHGTILNENKTESLDLYLYRTSEEKSIQIGNVNRLLKINSIDCLLNIEQTDFSKRDIKVNQLLSNGKTIKDYNIKDKEFTNICDYNKECLYYCRNKIDKMDYGKDKTTYKYSHSNNNYVIEEIKSLFLLKHIYSIKVIKNNLKKKK